MTIHVILCLISLLSFIACSKATGPDTGSIQGNVALEGQTDHSGVELGLYLPAELDPDKDKSKKIKVER